LKLETLMGTTLLCGVVGSTALFVFQPEQAGSIVSSMTSAFNTRRPPAAPTTPTRALPAPVKRVVQPSTRPTSSTRDDGAHGSAVLVSTNPSASEGSFVEEISVRPVAKPATPASSSATVLEHATAEFIEARSLFDREEYAAASARFGRVTGMLDLEPDLGSDLNRVAREFAAISRERAAQEAARQFTESDLDVTAPVVLGSSLPPPPPTGTPASRLDVLEVVIDANGTVEKARFITTRNHYRNRWWVSAAKAWRFQAAMRGAHPVRFVMRIQIDDGGSP